MVSPRTVETPPQVRSTVIEPTGRGVSLAASYVPAAEPEASVLLVHGWTGSKEDFSVLMPLLADRGFSAYSYDQRGQYESAAAGDDFSLDAFAEDAAAFAQQLPGHVAGQPVHLLGHSFGGLVAARTAIRHPGLWASVTLFCTGPGGHGDGSGLQLMIDSLATMEIGDVYAQKVQIEQAQGAPPNAPEVEAFLRRRFVTGNPASLSGMSQILIDTADQIDELRATGLPVFVVRGEGDIAWPQQEQDEMAARLGTSVVVIPDADHCPNYEAPEATADTLAKLLRSL
ncbi:alpha/beta hydrolase [Microlunatus panaciterrae]|uniref:Pimeloyl-ACP methyl ester carboxylesterase n=1 Tax=Microlunatus panaciterrae TaxID=400768 RepID=A0ABS2RFK9_9ACTN|nr:alpha/beta hydrolase [Microlunatus panaciterrae]MBM7797528.1 pimeloyl-ACP methyl ester carboxylesterase [Microlunatus panaciterrae]